MNAWWTAAYVALSAASIGTYAWTLSRVSGQYFPYFGRSPRGTGLGIAASTVLVLMAVAALSAALPEDTSQVWFVTAAVPLILCMNGLVWWHNRGLTPPNRVPPPDWYPDPCGGDLLRWWDGTTWQDTTRERT